MPNTLAHLGVQSIITRSLLKDADYKWIYLGCIIPDFPWILRRIVWYVCPGIDPYDLRLFAIIQSTFCFCLILSATIAALSVNYWRVFAILGINSFIHLFIDACQTKWANGVIFFAPFNWKLINFGLFWPESLPTYILTVFGIYIVIWNWRRALVVPINIAYLSTLRLIMLIALVAVYFTFPFLIINGPADADNQFVKTLRTHSDRSGHYIELDRNSFIPKPQIDSIRTFAGEEISVDGIKLDYSAPVSVKGSFVTEDKINVSQFHVHSKWFRDCSSYVGLLLVSILSIYSLVRQKLIKGKTPGVSV